MLKFQLVLVNSFVVGNWCTFAENFKYFYCYEEKIYFISKLDDGINVAVGFLCKGG